MTNTWKRLVSLLLAITCLVGLMAAIPFTTSAASGFGSNQILEIQDGSSKIDMVYRVWYPDNYDPAKEYKLMVFFHGHGSQGNNGNHAGVATYQFFQKVMNDPINGGNFIIVAPQCPSGYSWINIPKGSNGVWDWFNGANYDFENTPESVPLMSFMDFIVDDFMPDHNVDPGNLVLTGYSMGGYATWYASTRYADYVSTLIPVCGGNDPEYMVPILKDKNIYTFHTIQDESVNYQGTVNMVNALKAAGSDVIYRQYDITNDADKALFGNSPNQSSNWEHWAWVPAYGEKDVELANWLFEQLGWPTTDLELPAEAVKISYKSLAETESNAILYYNDYQATSDTSNFNGIQNFTHSQNVGFYKYENNALKVFYNASKGYHGFNYAFHAKVKAGTLTEDHIYARLKFKADKATTLTITMKGGSGEPSATLYSGTTAADTWIVTDPVLINVENDKGQKSCLGRLINNNHTAIGFETSATDVNFYVEEMTFFPTEEDAYKYYGEEVATNRVSISYKSLADTQKNAQMYKNDWVNTTDGAGYGTANVGTYKYENNALKVSHHGSLTSYMGTLNPKYFFHVRLKTAGIVTSEYKYMTMKVKADTTVSAKVGITCGGNDVFATLHNGVFSANQWTWTAPMDVSGRVLNRFGGLGTGQDALNHNAIFFQTDSTTVNFYVEEIAFFKTAAEAEAYTGIARSVDKVSISYKSLAETESNGILYDSEGLDTSATDNFNGVLGHTHVENAGLYKYENNALKVSYIASGTGYTGARYVFHTRFRATNAISGYNYMAMKIKSDTATSVQINVTTNNATVQGVLHNGAVAANEWMWTAPVAMNDTVKTRYNGGGHCGISFVTTSTTANFYVEEVAFFKSEKDALIYAGEHENAISYESWEETKKTGLMFNSYESGFAGGEAHSFNGNVGTYDYDTTEKALRIYSQQNGIGYLKNNNYRVCIRPRVNALGLTAETPYVCVTYKVKGATPNSNVSLNLINAGNIANDWIILDPDITDTQNTWVTTAPIRLDINDAILGTGVNMLERLMSNFAALGFKTTETIEFYLKEIRFFESEEAAYSYYNITSEPTEVSLVSGSAGTTYNGDCTVNVGKTSTDYQKYVVWQYRANADTTVTYKDLRGTNTQTLKKSNTYTYSSPMLLECGLIATPGELNQNKNAFQIMRTLGQINLNLSAPVEIKSAIFFTSEEEAQNYILDAIKNRQELTITPVGYYFATQDSIPLEAKLMPSNKAVSVTWTIVSGSDIAKLDGAALTAKVPGLVTVRATSTEDPTVFAEKTLKFETNLNPAVRITMNGTTVESGNSIDVGCVVYDFEPQSAQWYVDDVAVPGANSLIFSMNALETGTVKIYCVVDGYTSNVLTVTVVPNEYQSNIIVSQAMVQQKNRTYKVVFKDYDGTVLSEQTLRYKEHAVAPLIPYHEGMVFLGWDQKYHNVTEDLVITAKFVAENEYNG